MAETNLSHIETTVVRNAVQKSWSGHHNHRIVFETDELMQLVSTCLQNGITENDSVLFFPRIRVKDNTKCQPN